MPNKFEIKEYLGVEEEELNSYLDACQLSPEQEHYSDDDRDLIEKYRELVVNEEIASLYQDLLKGGNTPQTALEELAILMAEREHEPLGRDGDRPMSLFDLLKAAQELTGKPMTLSRALELLKVCGLREKPEYAAREANSFLEACEAIINKGQSLSEVAQANGVNVGNDPLTWLSSVMGQPTGKLQQQLVQGSNQFDRQVLGAYQQIYLERLKQMFESGEFQKAYEQERERLNREQGNPWDLFGLPFQRATERLGGNGIKTIDTSGESPQLPGA